MIRLVSAPIVAKDKGNGKWYFRIKYYEDEQYRDIRKRGFTTKKEAKLAEAAFETELFKGKSNEFFQPVCEPINEPIEETIKELKENFEKVDKGKGILVKDLYEEYVKYISTRLKAGSVRSASDVLRIFVLPDFGEREVASLSTKDILDWQEKIIAKGFGNFKNTDRKKEMLFWSEEEFKQFYAVIDDDLFRVYFSFLYLTGCRKGESLALTWNDIDFVRREVRINKSLNRKQKTKGEKQVVNVPTVASDLGWHISESRSYEITTPKNKSSYRNILMPMNLVNMLWEHQKRSKEEYGYTPEWFVFGGAEPLSDQTIRRRLNEYADKAGVKRIRVHDIRHSHASLLINKGQNILIVSQRLGHSDVTQTLNTYSHLMPNVQKQIINALDFEM